MLMAAQVLEWSMWELSQEGRLACHEDAGHKEGLRPSTHAVARLPGTQGT